jgi:hypothetical protein
VLSTRFCGRRLVADIPSVVIHDVAATAAIAAIAAAIVTTAVAATVALLLRWLENPHSAQLLLGQLVGGCHIDCIAVAGTFTVTVPLNHACGNDAGPAEAMICGDGPRRCGCRSARWALPAGSLCP